MRTLAALVAAVLMVPPAAAQPFAELDEAYEISLARSAAPAWLGDSAAVWVWRNGRHVQITAGRHACAVVRDHPDSLYPICFDEEAARTILPIELRMHALRSANVPEEEIRATIDREIAAGALKVPTRPALTYMMSRDQVLYTGRNGARVGAWQPHIMLYYPNMRGEDFGIPAQVPNGRFQVAESGRAISHLIVVTPDWGRTESVAAPRER